MSPTGPPAISTSQSPPSLAKTPLDLHTALRSVIRAWLVSRDSALWTFVSGVDEPIEAVNLDESRRHVERMNSLRGLALDFAQQIAEAEGTTAREVLTWDIEAGFPDKKPENPHLNSTP